MASNTGCASAGDWLMTRRISEVAVSRACAAFTSPASFAAAGVADERAVLAARFGAARRLAEAFLPGFFFGGLPFAEPRPMPVSHHCIGGNSTGFAGQPVGATR